MCRSKLTTLAVWLVPLWFSSAAVAHAGDVPAASTSAVSAFATPVALAAPSLSLDAVSPLAAPANDGAFAGGLAGAERRSEFSSEPQSDVRFESVRFRPRRARYRDRYDEPSRFRGVSQLHAGFLDPEGPANAGFLVGFRGGQQIDDMVELGLGIDWRNKSGRATEVLQETTGPGGERIVVSRELSRFSSNLFPVLAYVQVSAPSDLGVAPYVGFAGTYQALFLSAEDSQTGESFDATYDGWGWQLWGGAAVPLSSRSRVIGEVFWNNADLGRDVRDPVTGDTFRETVSTNGVGGRFGINWGF